MRKLHMILVSLFFLLSLAQASNIPVVCSYWPTSLPLQDSSCILLLEDLSRRPWIKENITWGENVEGRGKLPTRWENTACAVSLNPWKRGSGVQDAFVLLDYFNFLIAIIEECVQGLSRGGYARIGGSKSVRMIVSGASPIRNVTLSNTTFDSVTSKDSGEIE